MPNLKFKQLLIVSSSTETANLFEFNEKLNLIVAVDNSVGKSTLAKLLFWGLGCEPELDSKWNSTDSKTLVVFSVDDVEYSVKRYKSQISLKEQGNDYVDYEKIGGDFSQRMAKILGFKALLPNRKTGLMVTPPPAFYFLPFYIDQKRSWSNAWDNFEKLAQFENWKSIIVKYHVGLLTPKHFQLETQKAEKKDIQKSIKEEIVKIETTLEVVENYIPTITNATVKSDKFETLTEEIKVELNDLQLSQEKLLSSLAVLNSERVYLEQQKVITEKIIAELDKDYKYTIENIEEDEVECPLCGVVHENSIINRASIMTDKIQAENQLESLLTELEKVKKKLVNKDKDLYIAREQIKGINEKYIIEDEKEVIETTEANDDSQGLNKEKVIIDFNQIIENIAGNSIKQNVIEDKTSKLVKSDDLSADIRKIGKEQKALLTNEEIENINLSFSSIFTKYIGLLDAEAVNTSEINSPLQYNKVIKEGGAAEGSRAILAYYLTIFSMVEKFGNEVKAGLVIDTPNQQEQSDSNYDKIVDILTNRMSDTTQIIMCAMENEHIEPFREKAKVITLDKNKLLNKTRYVELSNYYLNN
ncbi:hypothetical protein [Persicobacter diffluens]|uniref:Rad50/SbcC-type AAA domain-containing protein n=1 Tax=Persicobacter diffluens TaxID=981 RepID=A0AAN4W0N7_9BACT|nr:hypothetical protein PEDI_37700 [Persicobacter diffluens]